MLLLLDRFGLLSQRYRVWLERPRQWFYLRPGCTDRLVFLEAFCSDEFGEIILAPESLVFDIGANVGATVVAMRMKWPDVKIVAFEPDSDNFEMLRMNCGTIPNVILVNVAIWSDGRGLALGGEGWGASNRAASNDAALRLCQSMNMAEAISEFTSNGWVDLVKMDVEGAEKDIFGASDRHAWIGNVGWIAVETHDRHVSGCDATVKTALEGWHMRESTGEKQIWMNASSRQNRR